MGKVKSSQNFKKEKERECWQNYLVSGFQRLLEFWIPDLERTLWQTGVMSLEGKPTDTSHNRGEAWVLRPNEDHFGQCPSRGMLGLSPRPFLMLETIQGEKKKFWCTHKNMSMYQLQKKTNNTQQAQSLDVREWSTAKIKLMPQGQRNRPH